MAIRERLKGAHFHYYDHSTAAIRREGGRFNAVAFDRSVITIQSPIGHEILVSVRAMRFPDLETLLVILGHHRIHEMFDGVFLADEAQEEEPDPKGNQKNEGYTAYRVAEPFRIRFLAARLKEGQIYPRLCCVPPLRVKTKLVRRAEKN